MGEFTDEMRRAVAAANDFVKREVEQAIAHGHSTHFMHEGRIIERTREGDFELVKIGDVLVRSHKVERVPESSDPFLRLPGGRDEDTASGTPGQPRHSNSPQ